MKPSMQHFRPLFPKCLGFCLSTFILLCCSCFIANKSDFPISWLFPVAMAVLHCVLVVFSVFRWNTCVYLHDNTIEQTQWGKIVVISYSEIRRVKIACSSPAPPTITIFSDQHKIAFDSTKADLFWEYCTNQKINVQIKMLKKR